LHDYHHICRPNPLRSSFTPLGGLQVNLHALASLLDLLIQSARTLSVQLTSSFLLCSAGTRSAKAGAEGRVGSREDRYQVIYLYEREHYRRNNELLLPALGVTPTPLVSSGCDSTYLKVVLDHYRPHDGLLLP
ncbi:uncharacterized protein TRAVEDRAFT_29515, partial [Trametes versicolor FP-101664 SS1]|uniref:uncharacterized protein n=1 Tax=Trametes versicolor (strain FP-101664) TaxID=717944 RepID=UPI00046220A5